MTKKELVRLEELGKFLGGKGLTSGEYYTHKYSPDQSRLVWNFSVRHNADGGYSETREYIIRVTDPRCDAETLFRHLIEEYRALLKKEEERPGLDPVVSFRIDFGTVSGYGVENAPTTSMSVIGEDIKRLADYGSDSPVKITGILSETRSIYSTDWGCPVGGEKTFAFSGTQNPEFCEDAQAYKEAVLTLAGKIQREYAQSRVYVSFTKAESFCLEPRD